ncbi:MAG: peptidoglycan-binding protein [Hamadaea sp.]|nr:peptidoglycan-binding protein [Hamadaea sp.]NUR50341.1 peptidoglycan-binding protein [Hamadaea sp.]NUT05111.1 peptidoglycan-binding protein [Hamadaea sp.]
MALAVAIAVLGTTLVNASPAAALPICNTFKDVTSTDGSGKKVWVPATWGGDVSCTLHEGILDNQAVSVLQGTLNYCYGMNLTVDGDFGPKTEAALMEVQRLYGLDDDGWYGVYTRDKISHEPYDYQAICRKYNGPGGY